MTATSQPGAAGGARAPQTRRYAVARAGDVPAGSRTVVDAGGRSIGVFNVNGTYVAVLNVCPHELIPICTGRVGGTTLPSAPGTYTWGREGEILACPLHGWEFDLLTGAALAHRRKRLKRFPVHVEDDTIYVEL